MGGKDSKNKDSKLPPLHLHHLVRSLASEDWWYQAGESRMCLKDQMEKVRLPSPMLLFFNVEIDTCSHGYLPKWS